jgi:hypothetical protein
LCTCEIVAKSKMTVIPHCPYSPGLALCDIFLFAKLKVALNGGTSSDTTMIQAKLWDTLIRILMSRTISQEDFTTPRQYSVHLMYWIHSTDV